MNKPEVIIKNHTPFPVETVIYAARTCKDSLGRSDSDIVELMRGIVKDQMVQDLAEDLSDAKIGNNDLALIKFCLDHGHESIMEHPSFTFEINFSRKSQQQLTRHRIASYSAESTRAVEFGETKCNGKRFMIPEGIKEKGMMLGGGYASYLFFRHMEACVKLYRLYVKEGISLEDAAYVLPLALCQPMVVTMDLRQWRHVLAERLCKHAQLEIRQMAQDVWRALNKIHPILVYRTNKRDCEELKNSGCFECVERSWNR